MIIHNFKIFIEIYYSLLFLSKEPLSDDDLSAHSSSQIESNGGSTTFSGPSRRAQELRRRSRRGRPYSRPSGGAEGSD